MRLVACPSCHTQYDVTRVAAKHVTCRCGERVETNLPEGGIDAAVHRCGSCGAGVEREAEACSFCGSSLVRDPAALSLVCPECYARNAEDGRFCTACGVTFDPHSAAAEEGEELPCPACGGLMPPRRVGGIAVNECPGCHGLWAPDESFDQLVRRALEAHREKGAFEEAPKPRVSGANPVGQQMTYRKCPVCDGLMQRRNFQRRSGIIVDWCGSHGTWLDADELEAIAGYIARGGRVDSGGPTGSGDAELTARQRAAFTAVLARNRAAEPERRDDVFGTIARVFDALLG